MTLAEPVVHGHPVEPQVAEVTCRLCLGSGRIAVGPWGVNPPKKTCPECLGEKVLPENHAYQDATI